jgi:polar amino acid transport system permease protein
VGVQSGHTIFDLLALSPPGWGGNLLRGAVNTMEIGICAYLMGLVLGMMGALAKLSGNRTLFLVAEGYTTLVRAVPELLLILLLYYAGTTALNNILARYDIAAVSLSGMVAGIGVLGFVTGAYATEVLRGAILAVPVGQIEAARAFGMSPFKRWQRIVIPAMLPYAIPGLANLWLVLTKETALLAVVGYSELALETRQAAGVTKAYFTFYVAAGAIYLTITLVSNQLFIRLERHLRRGMPQHR